MRFRRFGVVAACVLGALCTVYALCAITATAADTADTAAAASVAGADDARVPRYQHVFVVMDENRDFSTIDGGADAPTFTRLAREYGDATRFHGEVHPSEGNYVALLSGSTFGIHDDDVHVFNAPHIGTVLDAAGFTWKGYYQSIPVAGSDAVTGFDPTQDGLNAPPYYARKHSGFMDFLSVVNDPSRARRLVGFDAMWKDIAADSLPSFGFIVPNLCDDMHGMRVGFGVPADCRYDNQEGLIRRGDAMIERIVRGIMSTRSWRSEENVAVVLTFDESASGREGCCAMTPGAVSNFGGGHIPTIVITNHGPRGVRDATPYNHYSLLRTIEDAFGIHTYLGLAAAADQGVRPMTPLFITKPRMLPEKSEK